MKFREIIVKNINLEEGTYTNSQDEIKTFAPLHIYLVPKKGGVHDRFVTDSEGTISKQSVESNDTFNNVTNRGNSTNKNEIILASEKGRAAAIGFNETSYSYYFGDMNPEHTGSHNVAMGFNTLGKLTSGAYNTAIGGYSLSALTDGTYNTTLGYATAYKLNKSSSNVFIGQYTGFNLTGEVGESDLMNTSPSAAGYLKEMAYYSGYNGTSFHSSFNTFVGATINSGAYTPNRAAMSTIIGASNLNNSLYRNFNNIVVGAGNYLTTANSSMNNSIVIGNCINLPNQKDALAIGLNRSRRIYASEAIIYGELPNNRLYINAPLKIPSQYMPNAQGDGTFTKSIVAKSDGSFGWEDKVEEIPLTGTLANKPVSGKIEFSSTASIESGEAIMKMNDGYISFKSGLNTDLTINPNQLFIRQGAEKYITMSDELGKIVIGSTGSGIDGAHYYGDNYEDNSFVQKKYIDKKLSYSNQEQLTGGEWIDGKPIYKKTVKFESISSHGEISLATEFGDIEAIVSNQMFTEWYAMDVAFAGNQYRGKAFITLQPDLVKIENILSEDYDYSLIDSFTLTLEYTKKTV
ncbi:hypothetical protein [Chryseobacterium sp. RLHN22]|uniref:hypothetical protein n=1 Tax=Chryseobacterium sp. RLHN22 TaxID=3437885 RepID=UPI003D9B541D